MNLNSDKKHRKTIKHYNLPCNVHFLTFSCYKQIPLLDRDRSRNWLIESIKNARERYKYAVWAYVIMPEHVHLLVYPLNQIYNVSDFLKAVKMAVSRKAKHYLFKNNNTKWLDLLTVKRGTRQVFRFWQTGPGYDRNIISEVELFKKFQYIHSNPVRKGLVLREEEWKWSSASWYKGSRDVPLTLDDAYFSKSFTNNL